MIAKYVSSFVFLTVLCQKNCIKYKFYLSQIKFWRKITTSLIQWFSENLTSLPSHLLSHNWDVFHVDEWNTHLRNLVRLHRFPPAGCRICSYSVPSNDAYITLMYWWEAHITLLTSLSAKKKSFKCGAQLIWWRDIKSESGSSVTANIHPRAQDAETKCRH